MHERQMHRDASFVTLTYDDAHVSPSLNYLDFQRFLKRCRKLFPLRFFMCGEYGDLNLRPHFHALIFGHSFDHHFQVSNLCFASRELSKLWTFGHSSTGDVTFQSAGYVARYCHKKVTGDIADSHYRRVDPSTGECVQVVPEFARMSLKPGIGYSWFAKYWPEVYEARDGVVLEGGRQVPAPRYYDDLLYKMSTARATDIEYDRLLRAERFAGDCTPERLAVRETCALAKQRFLRREL